MRAHLLADYPGSLTGQPRQLNIQALVETELVVFDYALLRQLYKERLVYQHFGRLVAGYHLLGTDAILVGQLLLSPEARYRALLASGKTRIPECIPQQLVVNYFGVTPVSLSRIRGRVARQQARKRRMAPGAPSTTYYFLAFVIVSWGVASGILGQSFLLLHPHFTLR